MFNVLPNYSTMMPNLPAYWSLGNRHWVSNFGGSVQHNIYPDGYSPLVYALAQGLGNPNHISQWNPMLIGINLGQGMMTDPALIAAGNQAAANLGMSLGLNIRLSSLLSNLSGIEAQISSILKSDKLDESQKQRLQEVIDEIAALKERIGEMAKGQPSLEEVQALQGEVLELTKKASEVAQEIINEIKDSQASDNTDETDETDDADGTSDVDDADDADDADEASSGNNKTEKEKKELAYSMEKICDRIEKAVRGAGTNYDNDENGIKNILTEEINKDNVLELFEAWDRTYKGKGSYSGGDDDYGLIGTLMNDCEGSQKEEIAMLLISALEDKAHELGIDVASEVSAAKIASHGDWHVWTLGITTRNDDKICQAVNALYEKVKAGAESIEAKKEAKADKARADKKAKADKAKADAKKKEAEKIAKQKTQFRDDMREILGDDKAEVSDKVQYENNKFVIRIEGKNYYGKDYLSLAKALEKAGYDPAKYLKKQTVKAVA